MNDFLKSWVGLLGILAGFGLREAATVAAIAASCATALYMGLSALEKWQALRVRRDTRPPRPGSV